MAGLRRSVLLKAMIGFRQQFRGHAQISLRRLDVNVAEINGQQRKQLLHVCALLIPRRQPVDGKGVPQVMDARLVTRSIGAPDACLLAEEPVIVLERWRFDASDVARY